MKLCEIRTRCTLGLLVFNAFCVGLAYAQAPYPGAPRGESSAQYPRGGPTLGNRWVNPMTYGPGYATSSDHLGPVLGRYAAEHKSRIPGRWIWRQNRAGRWVLTPSGVGGVSSFSAVPKTGGESDAGPGSGRGEVSPYAAQGERTEPGAVVGMPSPERMQETDGASGTYRVNPAGEIYFSTAPAKVHTAPRYGCGV